MGYIKMYGQLYYGVGAIQPKPVTSPDEIFVGKPIVDDSKQITLAEYDVDTKNAITAHRLKDYRRRRFNLILLPKVSVPEDQILEGSEYWNALLHYESVYS